MSAIAEFTKGEEVMTDFQFRSIIKMVLQIIKANRDVDETIKMLEELLDKSNEK